ncbi:trk system potassium uptake protein TrkH [Pasteurella langaaensis DSM 22999]|uniref:Trk system potassium uptake protein n=1 Tax=Alitibacter langaaensis DSM 22999 TaxID=1122935 RepID=A0A2U0SK05_9PAST|nr:TrkH family potassium uptake protein [Pasteurella langaaensis]PVX31686.1 trk system potassium uptake protein TrkH [Pasteurella langaaensis DSM 22999]
MHILAIIRIVGILIMCFSLSMLVPASVALIYGDGGGRAFIETFFCCLLVGAALWRSCYQHKEELRSREGFLIVVGFWALLSVLAVIPFLLFDELNLDFPQALFESVSAVTTTGVTSLSGLDHLPKSILFYRQFLQWIGGIGLIVLVVAVAPMLGVGGGQLVRAESVSPSKDQKTLPRIREMAKLLWIVYSVATLCCALAYWFAGMSLFDAVAHSFSTISNGGLSTHDANLGYFQNSAIYLITSFFMLFGGCSFGLHAKAFANWKHQPLWKTYFSDPEFRFFCILQATFIAIMCTGLYLSYKDMSIMDVFAQGTAQLTSMSMTSGYTLFDFNELPSFLGVFLIFTAIIGGCSGSTGGGLKIIRVLVVWLQFKREIKYLVHPNLVVPIKVGDTLLSPRIIDGIWAFLIAFFLTYWICVFGVILCGMDGSDSMVSVFSLLTNAGPGLGSASTGFEGVTDSAKYVLSFAMMAGRLEIFSLLILFSPTFWKT